MKKGRVSLGNFDGNVLFPTEMKIYSNEITLYQPSPEKDGTVHCVSLTRSQIVLFLTELLSKELP